jgi:exopolysaccharide biosynthesis predicted pyruvyltransferase EpsI
LDFAPRDKIKIAYAASFGVDTWEYSWKDTLKCRNLLRQFKAVSVREETAVTLCRKYFNVNALHVVDPTMLILSEKYKEKFHLSDSEKTSGAFIYILDCSLLKSSVIDFVCNYLSLDKYAVMPEALNKSTVVNIEKCVFPSIEFWLQKMYASDYVITDSFHGCVFSIILNRPFIVINNDSRGRARIISLLKNLELSDRLVFSLSEVEKILNTDINWESVNNELSKLREYSLEFLKEYLNDSFKYNN